MKRRLIALTLCIAMISMAFAGCRSKAGENGEIYVYNWGEYIDESVIKDFEKQTGIKVHYDEFQTNEEMYPVIESGARVYDVICPSDYMIEKMIQNDLLAEIDFNNVPNIKNIGEAYMKSSEGFDPGNRYSVPYCWGTVGILYNKKMVDEPITSWSVLFDEKYRGKILMQKSVRDAYCVALSYLGYSINTLEEDQLQEATDLLIKQKPLVQAYVIDEVRDKMIKESAAMGVIYSGEAIYTQNENENLEYVVPEEGSNTWIDSWVITKNGKNKEGAEAWINYMCDPEVALKNFEYITYSTPNTAAWELIEEEDIRNSEIAFPGEDILLRCTVYKYLGVDGDNMYDEYWTKVGAASAK